VADRQATLAFIRRIIPFVIAAGIVFGVLGALTWAHVIVNATLLVAVWILCVVETRRRL
jgi:hypothetical protein